MRTLKEINRVAAAVGALSLCAVAAASCGIEKQSPPDLAGPSEFGTSIIMTASPDVVARDGVSQSTITLTVRDAGSAGVPGLPLNLSISPGNGGFLSAGQVVTDSSGRAIFTFTAPAVETILNSVTIGATPVGTNFDSAVTRTISIALTGPSAATPSFSVSPQSPQRFELVRFDAGATTFNGSSCGAACVYEWTLGNESTQAGQVVTHRFQQQGVQTVVLEVTAPTGLKTRTQQNITVVAGTPPTAVFTVSPTNPRVGDTVTVNANTSTAAIGATIAEYTWDFGGPASNPLTGTGVIATTQYSIARTFVIRLTLRDSNGLTSTTTKEITVATP